jgi:hypothetical protein
MLAISKVQMTEATNTLMKNVGSDIVGMRWGSSVRRQYSRPLSFQQMNYFFILHAEANRDFRCSI